MEKSDILPHPTRMKALETVIIGLCTVITRTPRTEPEREQIFRQCLFSESMIQLEGKIQ